MFYYVLHNDSVFVVTRRSPATKIKFFFYVFFFSPPYLSPPSHARRRSLVSSTLGSGSPDPSGLFTTSDWASLLKLVSSLLQWGHSQGLSSGSESQEDGRSRRKPRNPKYFETGVQYGAGAQSGARSLLPTRREEQGQNILFCDSESLPVNI